MPPKKAGVSTATTTKAKAAPKKVTPPPTMKESSDEESESPQEEAPKATVPSAKIKALTPSKKESSSDSDSDNNDNSSDSSDDSDSEDDSALVQLPQPSTTSPSSVSTPAPVRTLKRTEVWLDIQVPPFDLGRVSIELFPDCPLAHENFRALCTGEVTDPATKHKLTYAGTMIDQIHDDYIVLGEICDDADDRDGIEIIEDDFEADNDDSDDETIGGVKAVSKASRNLKKTAIVSKEQKVNIVHDTKKPAVSIYGGFFPDEPAGINRQHVKSGTVSMFAEKTNRNGSKFLITLKPHMAWLDGQYTVIGQVTNGLKTLHSLTAYKETGETAVISNCGRLKKNATGVDKINDFIVQASELAQGEGSVKKIQKKDEEQEKKAILCTKCEGPAKYKARQLGKGLRYICRSAECGESFWISDDTYDTDVVQKAMELKKEAKQQLHVQTVLMQNATYRKQLHQAAKDARVAAKNAKDELEAAVKKNTGKKLSAKAAEAQAALKTKAEELAAEAKRLAQNAKKKSDDSTTPAQKGTVVYASPDLAVKAQEAMAVVVDHKREKARAQAKGRQDHEKFVKEKKMERGELDEDGNVLHDGRDRDFSHRDGKNGQNGPHKRKFEESESAPAKLAPGEAVYDNWFNGDNAKKGKGNNERAQNRELKKIFTDKRNPEHSAMQQEVSAMSKDTRRQFKRQIGIQPGPSKTMQTNMNKKRADPKSIPKKSTFKSVQQMSHASTSVEQEKKRKKKDKTRWKDRDVKSLPDGFVSRAARRQELKQ